ncbi:MAG: hypothetical protein E3J66_04865 [Dehalococcoidia bacterium]|nr:MAG: hypothetical protein E3J66_04865 [Dehalococcoidia bacterium]
MEAVLSLPVPFTPRKESKREYKIYEGLVSVEEYEALIDAIGGTIEEIERRIVVPLLNAEDLDQRFKQLGGAFKPLDLRIGEWGVSFWNNYPRLAEKFFGSSKNIIREKAKVALDEYDRDTLSLTLDLCFHLNKNAVELAGHLNLTEEAASSLLETAINLDMCNLAVTTGLFWENELKGRNLQNVRTLIQWAKTNAIKYTDEFAALLKVSEVPSLKGKLEELEDFEDGLGLVESEKEMQKEPLTSWDRVKAEL